MQETKKKLRVGSRDSKLAIAQSMLVIEYLKNKYPNIDIELKLMKTTGDVILDRSLYDIGGKGLFVKELDKALLEDRTDISVHSLKDMPMELPEELPIISYSDREDPRDVLILPLGVEKLDLSKPIGTSSLRRELQLEKLYPGCICKSIRGNVQTRLDKLDSGEYGSIVLAAAGIKRLGLEKRISRYFSIEEMLPAAGQGILAVQGRGDANRELFEGYANQWDRAVATCERAFVRTIDGGCATPAAAYAYQDGDILQVKGLYVPEGSRDMIFGELSGNMSEAENLGKKLAEKLLEQAVR